MFDRETKLMPEMRQTMLEPIPTVVDIERLVNAAKGDEQAIEEIVRGYLRNALFVFQRHTVMRVLRDLDLKKDDLSEELLAELAADTGNYMDKFLDWFLLELNAANVKPKSTN